MENLHLLHLDRGTYYDRTINIITWSEEYQINVGKYTSIGRDCDFFLHSNHRPDWITTSSQLWGPVTNEIAELHMKMGHPSCKGNIDIGNDVWIGQGVLIMSGVTIGDGACIGANTVVSKDIPPYTIAVGAPMKFVRKRFSDEDIKFLLDLKWWNWPDEKINQYLTIISSGNINDMKKIPK